MPIIETRGSLSSRGYGQFAQAGAAPPPAGAFIEDVFSTTLYSGTGAAQSIVNGIALGAGATSAGWFASIFQSATSAGYGIEVDSEGNSYVCGYLVSSPYNVATLAKFSPSGALLWQTSLPSSSGNGSVFYAVAVSASGNVHVCGTATLSSYNGYLIAKYNSSGSLQWQTFLRDNAVGNNAAAYAITVDSSEFVYVTGSTESSSYITTVKLNSSGALQWQRRFTIEAMNSSGQGIAVDSSGNVHVVGTVGVDVSESTVDRGIVLKYNSSGTLLWQTGIGNSSIQHRARSCSLDAFGNVYVASQNATSSSALLSKYNSSGVRQWEISYGTSVLQSISLKTTGDGDSYLSVTSGGAINNAFVVKFNTSGTLQWQRRVQTIAFSELNAIALSGSESLWVTGSVFIRTVSSTIAARLPLDGSGTGAYTLSGTLLSYVVGSESSGGTNSGSVSFGADIAGVMTSTTPSLTNTPTLLTTALTPLAQGTGLGGLVWIKGRSTASDHALYDTTRGATADLASNSTAAQTTQAQGLTAFLGSGFSIGTLAKLNTSSAIYAAWTFAEHPKFFDIVTYTGDGVAGRTVAHNLGSVPGCIIIKRTNGVAAWGVYHRAAVDDGLSGATVQLLLNTTDIAFATSTYWNNTPPTSTVFTLGTNTTVNQSGQSYIAYLFAHDAGGFGATGTDNVISCGSYIGNGSVTGPIVTLGWEPQFLIIKRASGTAGTASWVINDNMRGTTVAGETRILFPNLNQSENPFATAVAPTATGFQINTTNNAYNVTGGIYIYIAVRRGPMRTPTLGTDVFMPTVYTGTNVNNRLVNTSIAPDTVWMRQRNDTVLQGMVVGDRLRGQPYWLTDNAPAEVTSATAFDQQLVGATEYGSAFAAMNGVWVGTDATAKLNVNTTTNNHIAEAFRRAPSFHDVVCYTGTGSSNRAVNHNLGVVPEFIIIKNRSATEFAQTLFTLGAGYNGRLSADSALTTPPESTLWGQAGSYIPPTSTVFTLGNDAGVNASANNYVAYLFASCPGVSKVGTYTGTGSTVQVDCGFTAGVRFVLIKRRDSNGNWFVWDSARGIVAGNDPYLTLNQNAAEVTGTDWVDTFATGFEISNAAGNEVNTAGGTYLFLAIA